MPTLLSPSGGEESNDNASTSEEYQVDEEVIEYLKNLTAIEPEREKKIQSHLNYKKISSE